MTEIRKANELVEMVKEYKAREKERIEKEVNEIAINIVEEILVPKAKEGESTVFVNCDKHRDAVINVLRENGYICDRGNNEIRIHW
jgi:hypothetical protein